MQAEIFAKMVGNPRLGLATNIRKFCFMLDSDEIHTDDSTIVPDADRTNAILQQIPPRLKALRDFSLVYFPLQKMVDSPRKMTMRSSPSDTPLYLEELDLSALSTLPDLRRVFLSTEFKSYEPIMREADRKAYLQAIIQHAVQLKNSLHKMQICVRLLNRFVLCLLPSKNRESSVHLPTTIAAENPSEESIWRRCSGSQSNVSN